MGAESLELLFVYIFSSWNTVLFYFAINRSHWKVGQRKESPVNEWAVIFVNRYFNHPKVTSYGEVSGSRFMHICHVGYVLICAVSNATSHEFLIPQDYILACTNRQGPFPWLKFVKGVRKTIDKSLWISHGLITHSIDWLFRLQLKIQTALLIIMGSLPETLFAKRLKYLNTFWLQGHGTNTWKTGKRWCCCCYCCCCCCRRDDERLLQGHLVWSDTSDEPCKANSSVHTIDLKSWRA